MAGIFVLAEHRQGQMRDITFEMLTKGRELADKTDSDLIAVILGKGAQEMAKEVSEYAGKVILIRGEELENFNSEIYKRVLSSLIGEYDPFLILMGHTSYGVDLAPRLAAASKIPLATDCIDLELDGEKLIVTRQMYGGKVNVKVAVRKAEK
ncbi:MAG: electron transfer flavoprotein subunit alpha/FixB family protein, partial [Candidatus Korarchaeota archaeon]|nr:electron transfer flavoprotein subunit alpha/FixB family protein [Candidatus Korarchaeota archaeon]